jgi:hypothetical protein
MEVIDDCTVFFFGILPHSLLSKGKNSSLSSPSLSLKVVYYQILDRKTPRTSSCELLCIRVKISSLSQACLLCKKN